MFTFLINLKKRSLYPKLAMLEFLEYIVITKNGGITRSCRESVKEQELKRNYSGK